MTVNKEFLLNRLVPALRSGDYKQGRGFLHKINTSGEDEYCCLGVACELLVEDGLVTRNRVDLGGADEGYEYCDVEPPRESQNRWVAMLPLGVAEYIGIGQTGIYLSEDYSSSLAKDNDAFEHDFNDIADTIVMCVKEGVFD